MYDVKGESIRLDRQDVSVTSHIHVTRYIGTCYNTGVMAEIKVPTKAMIIDTQDQKCETSSNCSRRCILSSSTVKASINAGNLESERIRRSKLKLLLSKLVQIEH